MEGKNVSFGAAALPLLLLATFSAPIFQLLYRNLVAFLSARRLSQIEVQWEGNKVYELEEDIVVEIFSRLPVKLLFQLKTVCRSWNAIISSPYLASMHLRNYTNGNASHQSLILGKLQLPGPLQSVMQLYPDANGDVSHIRDLEIPMPIISGPINGIFLLGYLCLHNPMYMWNPATGTFRQLPFPKSRGAILSEVDGEGFDSCGFGLDRIANDLKIVLIRHCPRPSPYPGRNSLAGRYSSPRFPAQVLVYTLGTDTWRELEEFRHQVEILDTHGCCRYLNGFVFWPCVSPVAALALDLGNDVFRVINDPVSVSIPLGGFFYVGWKQVSIYKEDSLALFIIQESGGYDMWLLSEDWCWLKYLAISPFIPKDMMVLRYWKENQLIASVFKSVEDQGSESDGPIIQFLLFDPCTQTRKVLLWDYPRYEGFFVYKESLVSVGEMRLADCSHDL